MLNNLKLGRTEENPSHDSRCHWRCQKL